jgi:hypothetical protein
MVLLVALALAAPSLAGAVPRRATVLGTAAPTRDSVRLGDESPTTRLSFAVTLRVLRHGSGLTRRLP